MNWIANLLKRMFTTTTLEMQVEAATKGVEVIMDIAKKAEEETAELEQKLLEEQKKLEELFERNKAAANFAKKLVS